MGLPKKIWGANKISLGIFKNNDSGYYYYRAVGFKEVVLEETETYTLLGEEWKYLKLEMQL